MSSSRDSTSQSQQELLERAKQLGLRALTLVDGLRVGDQASPLRGFSIEFAQHREYVPGDDLRHLDWRGYARTERFIVKQYDQETNYTAKNAPALIPLSRTRGRESILTPNLM